MPRPAMDPILDTAPCGFLSFTDDGTVQQVNQRLLSLLNRSRDDVEGAHVESLLSPGARLFYHTHLFPLIKMEGHVEEVYVSLQREDGEEVNCLLNASRTERNGRPVNDVVLVRFEERNQYEDEILQAKQAAEQANRAKEKFLSTVSHELQTPLSTIKSLSQYLSMGVKGPVTDEQKDYLDRIESAADYLGTLIDDILNFARLEAGPTTASLVNVPVADVLMRAESLVEVRFDEKDLRYEPASCPSDLYVHADPERLQQILLNLLTNAIKFTPPEGTISVSVEATDDTVALQIHDTGIGISPADQEDIFDPFVQGEEASEEYTGHGVGLGLAISRDLAEAMDGTIELESTLGEGSTFTVTLPRGSAPPGDA